MKTVNNKMNKATLDFKCDNCKYIFYPHYFKDVLQSSTDCTLCKSCIEFGQTGHFNLNEREQEKKPCNGFAKIDESVNKVQKFQNYIGSWYNGEHMTNEHLIQKYGVVIVHNGIENEKIVYGVVEWKPELPKNYGLLDTFKIHTLYSADKSQDGTYFVECSAHCGGIHVLRFVKNKINKVADIIRLFEK